MESNLKKKLDACKKSKCSLLKKQVDKEHKIFTMNQNKKCTQKKSNTFFNCTSVFYNKSKYKILFDKYVKCHVSKCAKEQKNFRSFIYKKIKR